MNNINAIITIALRDIVKFLRDKIRLISTFIFPVIFIGVLGGSFNASLGKAAGFNFLTFIFTGVLAQTMFQSSASGIISLIEDRENDFSQEMFVSPISRYAIVLGKILGESGVAFLQAIGIIIFGIILRVPLSFLQIILLIPTCIVGCLLGASFGVLVMSQLKNQRAANQIFPFLLFPQLFLSGVFTPIKVLPTYLLILSRIVPMTYAVDFLRSVFYFGTKEFSRVVLFNPLIDLLIISIYFIIFLMIGTFFFVRNQGNK